MKYIVIQLCIVLFSLSAIAQDFPYGKYEAAEAYMKKYDKDTSAHAVVLKEFGKAYIGSDNRFSIIFEHHVKIKIFDSKGFKQATVAIRIHKGEENVKYVRGITTYHDDKGNLQQSDLNQNNVYQQNINNEDDEIKFTLPNLQNNCIVEYSYTKEKTYHFNFQTWEFQSDIPKIYSEYETIIPAIWDYNITLRGYLKLSKNINTLQKNCFNYGDLSANCLKTVYAMNDIPAFVKEEHMPSPLNYLSALYFELSAITNGEGDKKKYSFDWKDIENILRQEDRFGAQIKRTRIFKDRIPKEIFSLSDTLTKAQAIYANLQKSFKFNNQHSKYSDDIKAAIDKHSGNVADINLGLVAALNSAGIKTDPVILSTRENGIPSKVYPTLSNFDYVIAKANIADKTYLLDATDPILAFGMLPLRAVNDKGRVISLDKPSYWIDLVADQKNKTTTTLDLTLLDDGKITGNITTYSFGYAAYNKRIAIKKFNTVNEYVENIDEKLPKLKIIKFDITNLDTVNSALVESYEVEIKNDKFNNESFSFTPAFLNQLLENPYKLTARNFPLETGSALDNKLILTLHYPNNLEIIKKPAAVGMAIPNNGGIFSTSFKFNPGIFNYSEVVQLNNPIYSPSEYPYIRELFNKIIQNQKADIVFNKKP